MDIPKLAFLGGGINSAVGPAHLAASRMDGRWSVQPSYFSHERDINERSHQVYGIPWRGHFESYKAWLDRYSEKVDCVVVLVPSTMHSEVSTELIRRRIPFLVEKPVACTLEEAAPIMEGLQSNPDQFARFVHNYSGYPMFRELVARIKSGQIGTVIDIRAVMPSDGYARESVTGPPQKWRQSDPEIPMLLLDLGTHLHHLIDCIAGYSESRVSARMKRLANSFGVVDHTEIWADRADGIQISMWMSKAHLGYKNGLSIHTFGTEGCLSWNQMDPDHLVQGDLSSNLTQVNRGAISSTSNCLQRFKPGHPTGFVEAFANFYVDLADDFLAQRGESAPPPWIFPMSQAFEGLRFLAAATRSFHLKQWQDV